MEKFRAGIPGGNEFYDRDEPLRCVSFSSSSSSFRLRWLSVERCLACEAELEHRAKATADKLSSKSLAGRRDVRSAQRLEGSRFGTYQSPREFRLNANAAETRESSGSRQ